MDKSWLMAPKVVAMVNHIRRQITAEFGVSLLLTDDDLQSKLATYTALSRNQRLRNLWAELEKVIYPEPEPVAATPGRVYRGQAMPEPAAQRAGADSVRAPREVVYRGQRMTL